MILHFHTLNLQSMMYALTGIVLVFTTAIWYVLRKEKEAITAKLKYVSFIMIRFLKK